MRPEWVVTTAKEYRKYAAECLESAKEAKSDSDRDTYLAMATAWLRAAALAEPIALSSRDYEPDRFRPKAMANR